MLGDKYVFEQWDCPDTVQAALRYPGFDVVYEGMMGSSIDDGGLEFRGTDATLKINRSGFTVYREGVPGNLKPDHQPKASATAPSPHGKFLRLRPHPQRTKRPGRNRRRRRPRRPHRQPRLPTQRPNHLAPEGYLMSIIQRKSAHQSSEILCAKARSA